MYIAAHKRVLLSFSLNCALYGWGNLFYLTQCIIRWLTGVRVTWGSLSWVVDHEDLKSKSTVKRKCQKWRAISFRSLLDWSCSAVHPSIDPAASCPAQTWFSNANDTTTRRKGRPITASSGSRWGRAAIGPTVTTSNKKASVSIVFEERRRSRTLWESLYSTAWLLHICGSELGWMLVGILESRQMGRQELMHHRKVCRTLVEGENTQSSYASVGGWAGSRDRDTELVESVIFVEVKGRSLILNRRHLLQQSLWSDGDRLPQKMRMLYSLTFCAFSTIYWAHTPKGGRKWWMGPISHCDSLTKFWTDNTNSCLTPKWSKDNYLGAKQIYWPSVWMRCSPYSLSKRRATIEKLSEKRQVLQPSTLCDMSLNDELQPSVLPGISYLKGLAQQITFWQV